MVACRSHSGEFHNQKGYVHHFDTNSLYLNWIAYKFTERLSVHGCIDSVHFLSPLSKSAHFEDLIRNAELEIPLTSIHSGIQERDQNIQRYFVSSLSSPLLHVKVLSVNEHNVLVAVGLNGIQHNLNWDWKLDSNRLKFQGKIDLDSFALDSLVEHFSQAVAPMHMGSDGVTKMWSDVNFEFSISLISEQP